MIVADTSFLVALLHPRDSNHDRSDKEYSAIDCLSFVVMLELGIREAFAFDSDFGDRFVMRPGPAK